MAQAAGRAEPEGIDSELIGWVTHHHGEWPALDRLFPALTLLGNFEVAAASTVSVAVVIVLLGHRRRAHLRKREAFFWLGVIISAHGMCLFLKEWFERARPPAGIRRVVIEESFSFPSGHSVYAAAFFSLLAILIARAIPPSRVALRWTAVALCAALAALVGASRVWLIVHYPTDVAGGLLLGVGWVTSAYVIRFGWVHWRGHRRLRAG